MSDSILDRAFPGETSLPERPHEELMIAHGRQFASAVVELHPDAWHESWDRFRETVGLVNIENDKVGSEIVWQSMDSEQDRLGLLGLSASNIVAWPIDDGTLIEIYKEFRQAASSIDSYNVRRTGLPLLHGILTGRRNNPGVRSQRFYLNCAAEVFARQSDEELHEALRAHLLSSAVLSFTTEVE